MNKLHHTVLIIVFAIVLLAGLLGTFFKWDFDEPDSENRRLADAPDFKHTPFKDWPEELEAYFNDHFGFRNTFIRRHWKIMRKIEKSNQVIFANEGWLFFNTPIIIQDYLGNKNPDSKKKDRVTASLQSRIDWLKKRNIEFLFVLVPNKISLHQEHLPNQLKELQGKSNRECLIETFDGRFDKNMLDLLPLLSHKKTGLDLYLKTDTHWNDLGAFFAHEAIIEILREQLPDLPKTITLGDLKIHMESINGDLARLSGAPKKHTLQSEKLSNPLNKSWTTSELTDAVFLTPEHIPLINKPPHTVHNPNGRYNVLIFHDSFTEGLQELLPHYFMNSTFIWRDSTPELLQAAVEACKPDIVIEQVVERFLVDDNDGAFLQPLNVTARK